MGLPLTALPKLISALTRHLGAYCELAGEEAERFAAAVAKRLVAAAIAVSTAILTMAMACLAILERYWDTPHRATAILVLALLFGAATLVSGAMAARKLQGNEGSLRRLREEWECDQNLVGELLGERETAQCGGGSDAHRVPEEA